MFTLDRELYLTADKQAVVDGNDPRAAFLLGNPGTEITDDEAKRLGLTGSKQSAPAQPEPVAAEEQPEPEAEAEAPAKPKRRSPRANKQRKPAEDK